jgi:hypothetical protein
MSEKLRRIIEQEEEKRWEEELQIREEQGGVDSRPANLPGDDILLSILRGR